MSGIFGAVAHRNVAEMVIEGVRSFDGEHSTDSSLALSDSFGKIHRFQHRDGLRGLTDSAVFNSLRGKCATAHVNCAHGSDESASSVAACGHCRGASSSVVIGAIEVPVSVRRRLACLDYSLESNSPIEATCALLSHYCRRHESVKTALDAMLGELAGTFALIALHEREPTTLYCVQHGKPLVIGVGIGEHVVGSQPEALLQVTDRLVWLESGDTARITPNAFQVWDGSGLEVERDVVNYVPHIGRSNNSASHSPRC